MKFLGKLVLWQKLLLIVVALLVPSALLSIFYLKNVNETVRQASTELTGARYTRARRPVKLVYYEKAANRSAACKREYAIKQLARREKLALIGAARIISPARKK